MTRCTDCGKPLDDGRHQVVITDPFTDEILVDDYPVCDDCWEGEQ